MKTPEFDSSDEEPVQDDQTPFQISWLALSSIYCPQFLGVCSLPVAACLLLQLSEAMEPQEAIDNLRDLRGSGAIQTIKQYNYLHDFRENLAAHLSTKDAVLRSVSR
uniref:protein-tyrosine-phosphatase n=1 Tax=Pelusios castaneus TaxID=367368 RepID=A0A8C8RC69_9SAUR